MKQNIYDNDEFYQSYRKLRKSGISYNDFVEQPAIKSAIGDIKGKKVLDLGCGAGGFAKYCVDSGAAEVVGVDISKNMIQQAIKENSHEKIKYICSPIEDIELANQTFDLIVSSLAIHYIEDYTSLIAKVYRLLAKNGDFVFSIEHPIVSACKDMDNWARDEKGNKLHWKLDSYHEEGKREKRWVVDGVITYHRTLSTIMNTLIHQGLTIEQLIEPQATSEGLLKMPKLINEKRRPSFLIIKSRR